MDVFNAVRHPGRELNMSTDRVGYSYVRNKERTRACAAPIQRTSVNEKKVVGMGGACLDYLAEVAAWPSPDDKLRTENLETQGGGNCANALTAAAKLGLEPYLVSKIGDDGIGEQILSQLQGDGVQTDHVLRGENSPSPFTYIIVDRTGGTRTCIHTPSAPLEPSELESRHGAILENAALVYFDGRLTEAAIPLAKAARSAGIPVLVEAERLRPHLETLLADADFVSTSAKFPQAWTGEEALGDALVGTLQRLPRASWVFTTLGSRGAVLVQRVPEQDAKGQTTLNALLQSLQQELDGRKGGTDGKPACKCSDGTSIWEGAVLSSAPVTLTRSTAAGSREAVEERAAAAAVQEAARNAAPDAAETAGYRMLGGGNESVEAVTARVFLASAAQIPQEAVRDTTGAGDASVGTLLYGICAGLSLEAVMQLAAVVSAAKCTRMGARPGLPRRADVRPDLLA